jgi:hypothetical protein
MAAQSMPMFLIAIFWGAQGIPRSWLAVALGVSLSLGIAIGHYRSGRMARSLLRDGQFVCKRVPGGVWFFIAIGLLVGTGGAAILRALGDASGRLFLHASGVVFGAICCGFYGMTSFVVLHLERTQSKKVYMGYGGFYFENG